MRLLLLVLALLWTHPRAYCLGGNNAACNVLSKAALPSTIVIDHYVSDPALSRIWAMVIDCAHPGWPPRIEEMRSAIDTPGRWPANSAAPVSVVATAPRIERGARVELWSDGPPTIRLSGIALSSASLGEQIQVRAGMGVNPLCGKVTGSRSVQLIGSGRVCRREP